MSDDRAHGTEDWLEPAELKPAEARRSGVVGKNHPTRARDATEVKTAGPARLSRFLREVVSELSKVIWPSRRELVVYTGVVLVFVSFMVAFVALLDMGLGKAVLTVFG